MGMEAGVTWGGPSRRVAVMGLVALALVTALLPAGGSGGSPAADLVSVIVRSVPGGMAAAEQAVTAVGGTVLLRLRALDSMAVRLPAAAVPAVSGADGVSGVAPDDRVRMLSADANDTMSGDFGTAVNVSKMIGSRHAWAKGLTGKGVGVAMIDTGIVPVAGLQTADVHLGPDLSPEGQFPAVHGLDTFGHGTHIAGLIAGGTGAAVTPALTADKGHVGTAPDATLLSLKVAASDGATDVSQVLAAINWVLEHRDDKGMNIRVLNLSFGTDGRQDYRVDPLAYAAEVAWRKGIVVVAAAGNDGFTAGHLANPAYDPHVLAVGASDHLGTPGTGDDIVASFSSLGDGRRNADLLAPGRSVLSYRNPNSAIDVANPQGRVGDSLFRGSGTSQAAAITSGAAAVLLQQRPHLTPDQVKALLTRTARRLPSADPQGQGAGLIDLKSAIATTAPADWPQPFDYATGTGSLDAARGTMRLDDGVAVLEGEVDIFGNTWSGNTWSGNTWSGNTWSGGDWNGNTWSGNTWSGNTWSGNTWSGDTWSGDTWSGNTWSGNTWSGNTWSGNTWSGNTWSGNTWSGNTWSGNTWSGNTWSGNTWSGNTWSGNTWSGNTWSGSSWLGVTWE